MNPTNIVISTGVRFREGWEQARFARVLEEQADVTEDWRVATKSLLKLVPSSNSRYEAQTNAASVTVVRYLVKTTQASSLAASGMEIGVEHVLAMTTKYSELVMAGYSITELATILITKLCSSTPRQSLSRCLWQAGKACPGP